ncbi:MAG: hypothetical protein AB7U20_07105 [Planctomycetaceae bacterium]
MHTRSCDLCDEPALIYETAARRGVIKVRRLCRTHGLKLWRDAVVPASEYLAKHSRKRAVKAAVTIPLTDYRHDRKDR